MHNILVNFVSGINSLNNFVFSPIDSLIEKLPASDWLIDAIIDSIHMLPFLFAIFVVIEIVEYFYSEKINKLAQYSEKLGPLAGSLAASFPQCGFSVIASTLYTKKMITKGTLLAVYLSTSDEAIPVILAEPSKIGLVVPLLITKIIIAVVAGYAIDFIMDKSLSLKNPEVKENVDNDAMHDGCCHHHLHEPRLKDLILHPVAHTLNVFVFILIVTVGLNFLIFKTGGEENIGQYFLHNSVFQPVITAIAGLIPNCAISVAITLMYLKGAISFGSVISGLCSSAGLGLLVLFKRNESIKDTLKIIVMLLFISIFSGILIQFAYSPAM